MHDNLDLPMLPSIDIYQLRCISNSISSFNKNILNYDYIIYGRIQKIAIKIERLNELIRNSVPTLKIKLNYIIKDDYYALLSCENNDNNLPDTRQKIAMTGFVDDLMDVKFELEKLISKTRYTLESLLVFHLNEPNKLKHSQYAKQKEFLVNSKNSKQSKVNELNNNLSVILAAEDIILKHKITDFFDRYFQGKELIDSIDIQPNKKDILKAAISYIRNLLTMVDDGLEFSQLVDVRIYISDQIIEAREEINTIDNNIFRLSQLMSYANDINQIEAHKQTIITQAGALKSYWESWCGFMSERVSEECLNFDQIKTVSQMLMTYLNDIEYQYQRQLPD